jgi:hypothetical protein
MPLLATAAVRIRKASTTALIEPLLSALGRGIANPAGASIQEGDLFSYALYLLAKWREPRAYPIRPAGPRLHEVELNKTSNPSKIPFVVGREGGSLWRSCHV